MGRTRGVGVQPARNGQSRTSKDAAKGDADAPGRSGVRARARSQRGLDERRGTTEGPGRATGAAVVVPPMALQFSPAGAPGAYQPRPLDRKHGDPTSIQASKIEVEIMT